MNKDISAKLQPMLDADEEIRAILFDVYGHGDNADYNSVVVVAIDCALRLYNVLMNIRRPGEGRNHRATMDLAVGLNGNLFWNKHGAVLMPIFHLALQAQADYAMLSVEKDAEPNITVFDGIRAESKLIGLEIFTMIAFLLGGHELLALKSVEIKKKLAPYLAT
jgi:hypothetical protein